MSRPVGRTTGAARDGGGGPRAATHAAGGVLVRSEPYDGPTAQSLVAALTVDIEERYAGDGQAADAEDEWALGADEVSPPRGVFLVAYLPIAVARPSLAGTSWGGRRPVRPWCAAGRP